MAWERRCVYLGASPQQGGCQKDREVPSLLPERVQSLGSAEPFGVSVCVCVRELQMSRSK